MLTFLRNIRRSLIASGSARKYLLYAIGEIALVVIGILIALQINTWNEHRKLRIQGHKTLTELRSDLNQTLNDIKGDRLYFQQSKKSNEIILQHMEDHLPYHDSLKVHFVTLNQFATFSVNRTTFDHLGESGSGLILNDSLRLAISNFYTSNINFYKEIEKRVLIEHFENYLKPMIISQFKTLTKNVMEPRDYEGFIANSDNKQIINFTVLALERIMNFQKYLIKDLEQLIVQIDQELEANHL